MNRTVETWARSVDDWVQKVVDTESIRHETSVINEDGSGSQLSQIFGNIDQSSIDSGVALPLYDTIGDQNPSYNKGLLTCMKQRSRQAVADLTNRRMLKKAVEEQRRYMDICEQLQKPFPLSFSDICEMEETLAGIYQSMGTMEGREEARKIFHALLQQEMALPEADKDKAREGRLYHQYSKIYIGIGGTEEIRLACLYSSRAFDILQKVSPVSLELVKESAKVLYQAFQKTPSPHEAMALDDYTKETFGFTLNEAEPGNVLGMSQLLEKCRHLGFDVDQDGFRFDVCDLRLNSPVRGISPLHYAVQLGNSEFLGRMLDYITDIDVREEKNHVTPLLLACSLKDSIIVELLLSKDARVTARDRYDCNGLHLCQSARGGTKVARLLLEHEIGGVPAAAMLMNATNGKRQTALYMASSMGNKAMVELLLKKQVSPNTSGPGGWTALMATVNARMNNIELKREIVTLLVMGGADPTIQDDLGHSAIDICNDSQLRDQLKTLATHYQQAGKSERGDTPLTPTSSRFSFRTTEGVSSNINISATNSRSGADLTTNAVPSLRKSSIRFWKRKYG